MLLKTIQQKTDSLNSLMKALVNQEKMEREKQY